jgi:UDP-glucose 4-epimerase
MFKFKYKFFPKRPGERYASALTNLSYKNKIHKRFGNVDLSDYIKEFLNKN